MTSIGDGKGDAESAFEQALDHAWNWFSLHAGQRLQCVYFFILASAALVAGFASTLTGTNTRHGTAFVITVVGIFMSIAFNLLERRTKELVKAGEAAMLEFERRLAEQTGVTQLMLISGVEKTNISRAGSYSKAINMLHYIAILAWLGAAVYAWQLMYPARRVALVNILGLTLNAIGVVLLFFFAMPYRVRTGGNTLTLKSDIRSEDVLWREKVSSVLAWLGLTFVFLGSAFQVYVSLQTLP